MLVWQCDLMVVWQFGTLPLRHLEVGWFVSLPPQQLDCLQAERGH
jgi:hypothetical protein